MREVHYSGRKISRAVGQPQQRAYRGIDELRFEMEAAIRYAQTGWRWRYEAKMATSLIVM